uniref:Endo/exonuclease/phosphatase domain-containing protein n=1 Tax=Caenorhabditis japonica TaxID=281687 RepID=A0A8R1HL87_CAEJA
MVKHNRYFNATPRGRGMRGRIRGIQRRRTSNNYMWNTFQQEDAGSQRQRPIIHSNIPPPPIKPIETILLGPEVDLPVSSGFGTFSEGTTIKKTNFCSTWLAKNQHLVRPKPITEEIIIDDSEVPSTSGAESIVLLESERASPSSSFGDVKNEELKQSHEGIFEFSEDVDFDENIVIIGEVKRNMTLDTAISTEKFRAQPTSSFECVQIKDGFSIDCNVFRRAGRCWMPVRGPQRPLPNPNTVTSKFIICSYNVLCQKTIERTSYLYRHLQGSEDFLDWNYRWNGLKSELSTFNADILGLQEVQAEHFEQYFEPFMRGLGYIGKYKRKSGTEQKDDGCALFYRQNKFEDLGYQEVEYFLGKNAISNRENIGQILVLRCLTTGEILIIGNTHLIFNQERGDVKLAQLAILFAYINTIKMNLEREKPLIMVMGDFNMEANSKVFDFIVNGKIHIEGQYVRTLSGQSERSGGSVCVASKLLDSTNILLDSTFRTTNVPRPPCDGHLSHQFNFSSAYHHGISSHGTKDIRPISTYHKDAAAPDFIFFTPEKHQDTERLQLLEKFALPTIETLNGMIPWPNRNVPSDHLPILAKFLLTKRHF